MELDSARTLENRLPPINEGICVNEPRPDKPGSIINLLYFLTISDT